MREIPKTQSYRMWRALFAVQGGITDVLLARFISETKDLSLKEHMVMRKVHTMMEKTPQGIPLKDLAAALHLTPGTVSELVEKLVRKGTLCRVQNPSDRRAVMITVTEKSLSQLAEAMKMINAFVDDLWKDFSDEEKEKLTETLELLLARIEASKDNDQKLKE